MWGKMGFRKKIGVTITALLLAGCSTSPVMNTSVPIALNVKIKHSVVLLSVAELKELDEEYAQFSTKALSGEYLLKKILKWKDTNNGLKMVKEIDFARQRHPDLFKTIMLAHSDLFTFINGMAEVIAKKPQSNNFRSFLEDSNPFPAAVVASTSTNVLATSFTANWSSVTNATGYILEVTGDPNFVTRTIPLGNVNSYDVTGLNFQTAYTYRVKAINNLGEGPFSNTIDVTTGILTPTANPATEITEVSFKANWIIVPDATAYTLTVKKGNNTISANTLTDPAILAGTGNTTGYSVTGLEFNTNYSYFVSAETGNGATNQSNTVNTSTVAPRIVFASNSGANYQINVMNSNGSNQLAITTNNFSNTTPSWSPDRSKISYVTNKDGNNEIYLMNSDGSNQSRLTTGSSDDLAPNWSPDGSKIAFYSDRNGNYEIYVMDANGSNQSRLTNNSFADAYPYWSPDGSKIVFTSYRDGNAEIYLMNADGSNQTRFTGNTSSDSEPSWSPDGTKIAFTTNRDGSPEIYVMNADGSNQTRVTNNAFDEIGTGWSPDGTKIIFVSSRDGNHEIYTMNPNGSNITRVTNNSSTDVYANWGPVRTPLPTQPVQSFGSVQTLAGNPQSSKFFTIGADSYLAVVNGGTNDTSKIYKWTGTAFTEIQQLSTHGTKSSDVFTIGSDTYLVMPNSFDGSSTNLPWDIYKWNGSQFAGTNHPITEHEVFDAKHFIIGTDHYLAIAVYHDGTSHNTNSKIYKWDGTSFQSVGLTISTHGAGSIEAFKIGADTYLAVANGYNGSTHNTNSEIFKWNGSNFTSIQGLATFGGSDTRYFKVGADDYLAFASSYQEGVPHRDNLSSRVYKWNGSTFGIFEGFTANSGNNFEFLQVNNENYLTLTSNGTDSTQNVSSMVYKWYGLNFIPFQSIATNAATHTEPFVINGSAYIAISNNGSGNTSIYKLQ
jgi:Tol biopolymer transport system component